MSTTTDLVIALKKELKSVHMTYADLAEVLDMAESSVKRMLAKGDMPRSRVADTQPLLSQLTPEQESRAASAKRCHYHLLGMRRRCTQGT